MRPEHTPDDCILESEWSRPEFQGDVLSCTIFGATSGLECLAARAGEPIQLSARFGWYYSNKGSLSVDSAVATVNRVGLCLDSLCPYVASTDYPYKVADLDVPPSLAALLDASARNIKMRTKLIAGKEELKRSIARGMPIISIRVYPGGIEHCECIIGYSESKGIRIHGSGGSIYWEPWESLSLVITQMHQIIESPWAPVAHPDYYEGDLPTFQAGVLYIPQLDVVAPFMSPWSKYVDVELVFSDYGTITANDERVQGYLPRWNANYPTLQRLSLPTLIYEYQRVSDVLLINPAFQNYTGTLVP